MNRTRTLLRAGLLPLALLAAACAKPPDREGADAPAPPAAARAEAPPPPLTVAEMQRPSPSAAIVAAFAAICAEPASRPVAREAADRRFTTVAEAALREEFPGDAFPPDAALWRGPPDLGGTLLVWDPGTATCEMRAQGVDAAVVGAEFAKLPEAFEAAGATVMRLRAPPAAAGGTRAREMLLVSPGGRPERARVLRLIDDGATQGAVVLAARSVSAR